MEQGVARLLRGCFERCLFLQTVMGLLTTCMGERKDSHQNWLPFLLLCAVRTSVFTMIAQQLLSFGFP